MKIVVYIYTHHESNIDEYNKLMNILCTDDKIVEKIDTNEDNHIDYIYLNYNEKIYKFNRYDKLFIKIVQETIGNNLYRKYKGPLWILEIDNRFTNKKYYRINQERCSQNLLCSEYVEMLKDLIINDLYEGNFEK